MRATWNQSEAFGVLCESTRPRHQLLTTCSDLYCRSFLSPTLGSFCWNLFFSPISCLFFFFLLSITFTWLWARAQCDFYFHRFTSFKQHQRIINTRIFVHCKPDILLFGVAADGGSVSGQMTISREKEGSTNVGNAGHCHSLLSAFEGMADCSEFDLTGESRLGQARIRDEHTRLCKGDMHGWIFEN